MGNPILGDQGFNSDNLREDEGVKEKTWESI